MKNIKIEIEIEKEVELDLDYLINKHCSSLELFDIIINKLEKDLEHLRKRNELLKLKNDKLNQLIGKETYYIEHGSIDPEKVDLINRSKIEIVGNINASEKNSDGCTWYNHNISILKAIKSSIEELSKFHNL